MEDPPGISSPSADDELNVVGCMPRLLPPLHRDELFDIVLRLTEVVKTDREDLATNSFDRYVKLLDIYQEQPAILDPIIPRIIEQLLASISLPTSGSEIVELDKVTTTSLRYLAHLAKVRGYKVVVRLLPHHVSFLEKLLLALELYAEEVGQDLLERRMLLFWLWIVCKNPFSFSKFDPINQQGRTLKRIFEVALPYVKSVKNNGCQGAAALVISQCLARNDGFHLISDVVSSTLDDLTATSSCLHGSLVLLLAILKHVDRVHVLPQVDRITASIRPFVPLTSDDVLVRKNVVKMVQRLAQVLLRPRVASWRYRRGRRKLEDNLPSTDSNGASSRDESGETALLTEDDDETDAEPHPLVEWALECALLALCDDDTTVRWSAAKGVGRITSRLPRYLASQVVETIVSHNFHRLAGNGSWHGGCMALAELSRRGFLLPEDLPKVFPLIQEALFYEEPMGRHALGSNVRDAACYVFWAFARAYEPVELRPYIEKISTNLICVALFDRQVNLRRAASAAFQENVGRQTEFPDGIDLLKIVDYFAVGNRERCYTQICLEVILYRKYADSIIDHLIDRKVAHWDSVIRQQSATAIGLLASLHGEYLITKLPQLMEGCKENTATNRHGFLLAFSHAVAGLLKNSHCLSNEIMQCAAQLPVLLQNETKKLKSAGGEYTRLALTCYIQVLSEAPIPLTNDQISTWLSILESTCKDDTLSVRTAGASAAARFFPAYLATPAGEHLLNVAQDRYMKEMESPSRENAVLGLCSLISVIPSPFFSDRLFKLLSRMVIRPGVVDRKWALSRAAAVRAVSTVYQSGMRAEWNDLCFETLLHGLNDYTEDPRGDIGRHVREASMACLADVLTNDSLPKKELEKFVLLTVKRVVQQSAEKIGRTRECACQSIIQLLSSKAARQFIANADVLEKVYRDGFEFIQDSVLPTLLPLLSCETYFADVLHGLISSAGGVSDVTVKNAIDVINEYLNSILEDVQLVERLVGTVADMFVHGMKVPRVGNAVLRYLPRLLGRLPPEPSFVDNSASVARIVSILKRIASSNKSPARVRLALESFSSMLSYDQDSRLWHTSIVILAGALSSPLPVIRRSAAEAMYDALCMLEFNEEIIELLLQTSWQDTSDIISINAAAINIQKYLSTM